MVSTWRRTCSDKGVFSVSAGEHTQGRFEEMRQIGDVGAGAAHHFVAVFDQGIEFGGKRRDFGGKIAFQSLRAAVTDARQRFLQSSQRQKTDPHLQKDRDHQSQSQKQEGPE
jgi:hypothetical protein